MESFVNSMHNKRNSDILIYPFWSTKKCYFARVMTKGRVLHSKWSSVCPSHLKRTVICLTISNRSRSTIPEYEPTLPAAASVTPRRTAASLSQRQSLQRAVRILLWLPPDIELLSASARPQRRVRLSYGVCRRKPEKEDFFRKIKHRQSQSPWISNI